LQINRLCHIAIAYYFLREYEAAAAATRIALRSYPNHPLAYRWFAAALGQAGRLDEAKQALTKLVAVTPKAIDMFVRQRAPWYRVEDYEHMLEGLRKAGWFAPQEGTLHTAPLVAEPRSAQPPGEGPAGEEVAAPAMSDRRRPEVQPAGDMSEGP